MESINISVVRRQLETDAPPIINWNTDYILAFSFDEEWEDTKTIRIVNDKGAVILDEIFMGNSYELPKISNTGHIGIGLYAGDLKSTTPLIISCRKSILDYEGTPIPPTEDVYNQIMAALNEINEKISTGGGGGGADGKDGISCTHEWNGTVLTVTSASGTSSADLKGDKGERGEKGEPGVQGEKGDTGAPGQVGEKGTDGKDGISCTHSWNGTTLTVTSASGTSSVDLKGEKGDKGDTGERGQQGEKGADGADGKDGADGYTPVRGTDYWTEADKAEIKGYVDTSIGDIETALDSIIAIQNTLIGGETA